MKIYFSGSISSGRQDIDLYVRIVDRLRAAGHEVLAGNVTNRSVGTGGEGLPAAEILARDLAWIAEAAADRGALVAEVSVPSTGVGYEIAVARHVHRIPVICLYRPGHSSRCTAMVAGDPEVLLIEYTAEAENAMLERLENALKEIGE